MNNQILLIYDFDELFKIFDELQNNFIFKIKKVNKDDLNQFLNDHTSLNLFLTRKKITELKNQIILNEFPMKFTKLIEKININFLKLKFNQQSEIKIGKYSVNLNSRKINFNDKTLNLTEKECEIIIYLMQSNKPVSIIELQKNVWAHHSKLETHTVETHIYRLRKKISESFGDNLFIFSEKNGYRI